MTGKKMQTSLRKYKLICLNAVKSLFFGDHARFMRNATANELIYDDHGIPIPEMDGSIHDELHQGEYIVA